MESNTRGEIVTRRCRRISEKQPCSCGSEQTISSELNGFLRDPCASRTRQLIFVPTLPVALNKPAA